MWMDTHAHLDYDAFDADRDEVIQRARDAGVQHIVTIGTNLDSSRRSIDLAEKHEEVLAVVGHHPTDAVHWADNLVREFERLVGHPRVVGVGETGLDYYWKESTPESQKDVFRVFIRLSEQFSKPLIIHVRDAHADLMAFLKHERPGKSYHGVMHCFSGDETFLTQSLELGFHISFAGNVTYKNSKLPALIPQIPRDRILIETDAPFLPPVPHRGQRNEPAFVRCTASRLAELLGESEEAVGRLTTSNAKRCFRIG